MFANNKGADQPTHQLALESMIAEPATCKKLNSTVRHACTDPDNSKGEGGPNCFSKEVRTKTNDKL